MFLDDILHHKEMTSRYLDFDKYNIACEPHKREQAEDWKVSISLPAAYGLTGQSSKGRRRIVDRRRTEKSNCEKCDF